MIGTTHPQIDRGHLARWLASARMPDMKTLRILQAIADTHNGTNLKEVLFAQVEYVREALPVLTRRQAVEWMLGQPWRTQEEFMPAGYEAVEPVLRQIAGAA